MDNSAAEGISGRFGSGRASLSEERNIVGTIQSDEQNSAEHQGRDECK